MAGEMKYEDAMKRLEKLVGELDSPELSLELRLKKFEEGTRLTRLLMKKLETAKKKVEFLMASGLGEITVSPADADEFGTEPSTEDAEPGA